MIDAQTHLAVAIAAPDTTSALGTARELASVATLVEYRLDLMADFDLAQLVARSPLPAIMTCRSPAEGGRFGGSERERRSLLQEAIALGAPLVDVEAGLLPELAAMPGRRTRLIGSRHDFSGMLGDWASAGLRLRAMGADIVKLVGTAHGDDDVLPPLAWLAGLAAETPGIAIAMGAGGVASRLLAPRFASGFLSFAAAGTAGTAAGQVDARTLAHDYGFHRVAGADPFLLLLCPVDVPWNVVAAYRQALAAACDKGSAWLLPVPCQQVTAGLLLACQLADVRGIIALPDLPRHPDLAGFGAEPAAAAWRWAQGRWQGLRAPEPEIAGLIAFVLTAL